MFRRVAKGKGDHGPFSFAADDGKTLITVIKRRALVDIRKFRAADHIAANLVVQVSVVRSMWERTKHTEE